MRLIALLLALPLLDCSPDSRQTESPGPAKPGAQLYRLLADYETLRARIDAAQPRLFDVAPKAPYVIKPIDAFRAASQAAAEYNSPTPDGSRPGIFYVNTYDLPARPTYMQEMLSIHEAAPGHHFQMALAMEQTNLPDFRRYDGPNAYVEGWGLYTESLGKALGLFHGQALSYKIGQLKLLELRARAEAALGDKFDIKAFHRQVLIDGAMPLSLLEAKLDRWIAGQRAPAAG